MGFLWWNFHCDFPDKCSIPFFPSNVLQSIEPRTQDEGSARAPLLDTPSLPAPLSPLDQEEAPDDDDGDADGAETETEQGVQETVPVATLVTTAWEVRDDDDENFHFSATFCSKHKKTLEDYLLVCWSTNRRIGRPTVHFVS